MATVPFPTLDQVIGWIESRNDNCALRFEPRIYATTRYADAAVLSRISRYNHCSPATAKMLNACSFGRFQIMGFNLYSAPMLLACEIGQYFSDPDLQRKMFYEFVAEKCIDYPTSDLLSTVKRTHFAQVYNGSLEYADSIVAALQHFGVQTP